MKIVIIMLVPIIIMSIILMCVILFIFQSIFVEKATFLQTSARFKPTANTAVPVGQDSNRRRTLLYLLDKIYRVREG